MELDERAELDELAMDGLGEEDFSSDVKSPFNSPSSKDSESLPQSLAVPAEPEPTATLTDESMDELTDELTDETVALNELVEDFFDNGMDFTSSSRDCAMDNRPCNMAISLSLTKGCEDNLLEIFSLELMVTILQCNGNSVVVTKSNDNIVISFRRQNRSLDFFREGKSIIGTIDCTEVLPCTEEEASSCHDVYQ